MSEPWLAVVGIGEDGLDGLSRRARDLVDHAALLVGGRRHLAMVPEDGRRRLTWSSPLTETLAEIAALAPCPTVVLASGDPGWFGVAKLLRQHFPDPPPLILPAPSAFQLAAAALGWALEDVTCVSLHGRPIEALHRHLAPGVRLLLLTSGRDDPLRIAAMLADLGHGATRLWVLEHLGGPRERHLEGTAAALPLGPFADLHVLALELDHPATSRTLPAAIGLPDEAFEHDGQLTKREIRAATLAMLAPGVGELLWDVGAGAGSIAIEWLRAGRRCRAIAIERDPARVERIARNAAALGTSELLTLLGTAPAALEGLEAPDVIFIGGGVAENGLLASCWHRLRPGGRLVANAVTLAGEAALLALLAEARGQLLRLRVERAEPVGGSLAWRPAIPVTQLVAIKQKSR